MGASLESGGARSVGCRTPGLRKAPRASGMDRMASDGTRRPASASRAAHAEFTRGLVGACGVRPGTGPRARGGHGEHVRRRYCGAPAAGLPRQLQVSLAPRPSFSLRAVGGCIRHAMADLPAGWVRRPCQATLLGRSTRTAGSAANPWLIHPQGRVDARATGRPLSRRPGTPGQRKAPCGGGMDRMASDGIRRPAWISGAAYAEFTRGLVVAGSVRPGTVPLARGGHDEHVRRRCCGARAAGLPRQLQVSPAREPSSTARAEGRCGSFRMRRRREGRTGRSPGTGALRPDTQRSRR